MRKRIECTGFLTNTVVAILIIVFFSTTGWCADKIGKELFNFKDYQNLNNHINTYYAEKYTNNGTNIIHGRLLSEFTYSSNTMEIAWEENYENGDQFKTVYYNIITDIGQYEIGSRNLNLQYSLKYENPVLLIPYSFISLGDSWGGGTILRTYNAADELLTTVPLIWNMTVVNKEAVEINVGLYSKTYPDCIVVARVGPTLHRKRVVWYAKGLGVVKYIYQDENYNVKFQLVPNI